MDNLPFVFRIKKQYTPKDTIKYVIPAKVIRDTERVLIDYANIYPSNEGLVYWGGTTEGELINVSIVIAPETESSFGRVSTSNRSNFDVVRLLNKKDLIEIGQVHSHPTEWVDHSIGDDKWAPFKIEGLISIVVPEYCKNGMSPLTICGIHRYTNGKFIRLSEKYISAHFKIVSNIESGFEDFRK